MSWRCGVLKEHSGHTKRRRRSATRTMTRSGSKRTPLTQTPSNRRSREVESDRGAVPALPPVRFPGPLPEPDVRLPTHPALHEPQGHPSAVFVLVRSVHGVGIFVPR